MELSSLFIHKDYGTNNYKCSVTFKSESGTTELKLLPGTSEAVLAVIADQILEAAKETANRLTREVIDMSTPQLGNDNDA